MRDDRHRTVSRSLEKLTLECLSLMDEQEWTRRRELARLAQLGSGTPSEDWGRPALSLDGDTWVCEWPRGEELFSISKADLAAGAAPTIGARPPRPAAPELVTAGVLTATSIEHQEPAEPASPPVAEWALQFPHVYPAAWLAAR